MEYEIVSMPEKMAAGLMTRTNNFAPDMGEKIGGLWQQFFGEGIYGSIRGRVTEKTIGLYTNYAGTEHDDYDMYVCSEVQEDEAQPEGITTVRIEGGRYARFIVRGHMVNAVQQFWQELWAMELDRKFSFDYEEYQPSEDGDMENCEIHMYISLK